MTHTNDMTAWDAIACRAGCAEHVGRRVDVHVGGPSPYHDFPPIPERFARDFAVVVHDWRSRVGLGAGVYCPARDAVSETIDLLGVWEPCETSLVLAACTAAEPGSLFVDFGSQVGWFGLLAASCGLDVIAYEADPVNVEAVRASFAANGWDEKLLVHAGRVDGSTPALHVPDGASVAVAKIDVEGAEPAAVDVLSSLIAERRVHNLLVEISPCFHDGYPDLVELLVQEGFRMHLLPAKAAVPPRFDRFPDDLGPDLALLPRDELRATVAGWHQENVWFTLAPEARW